MTNASFTSLVSLLNSHPARNAEGGDIQACFNPRSIHHFSEATMHYGEKMGFDWVEMFAPEQKQKQIKRATQFINNLQSGISQNWDKTHTRLLVSMRAAGEYALTTDALHSLAANTRNPNANTRGIGAGVINAVIKGNHGLSTVKAKTSNSTGKGGFMNLQNMTASAPTQNHEVFLNTEHPAVIRFFAIWDSFTAAQKDAVLKTE